METVIIERQKTRSLIISPNPPVVNTAGLASNNPRYKICEYLLLVIPDNYLYDEIMFIKRDFADVYRNPAAIYEKPHITLANFVQSDIADYVIINRLKTIARNANRIKVVLKDYQWFPSHTMYIDVLYKTDIQQLVRKISDGIKRFAVADKKYSPWSITEPHLTICKDLSTEQYEKSWIGYANKEFSAEFTADVMILLKRSLGEKKYQQVGCFEFSGPEILTKVLQGKSFENL